MSVINYMFDKLTGYSGNFATAVGYVLVTNLNTGVQRGGWDKPEVLTTFTLSKIKSNEIIYITILLYMFMEQIHFHEIPDEVIERVVCTVPIAHILYWIIYFPDVRKKT